MKTNNDIIVRLYNGCKTAGEFETKEDWGELTTRLEPIREFKIDMGGISVRREGGWAEVKEDDDDALIVHENNFYGDFEIISSNNIDDQAGENDLILRFFNEEKQSIVLGGISGLIWTYGGFRIFKDFNDFEINEKEYVYINKDHRFYYNGVYYTGFEISPMRNWLGIEPIEIEGHKLRP